MDNAGMRANRLLRLLLALQLRGKTTASALARQCEVSVRTIYRDLEALESTGVPIVTDRGREGGVQLLHGYQTRLTGFTQAEADSLPFMQLHAAATALGQSASADAARLKVLAALPASIRDRALRASERFHVDPAAWYQRHVMPEMLRPLAEAVWTGHSLELDYQSWKARSTRTVEPLGLVLKGGSWYMVARSPRKTHAIYKVDCVHSARILPQKVRFPRAFDLAAVWQEEVSRFEASLRKHRITVRVGPGAMSRVGELGADAAEAIQAAEPDASGCRQATFWMESITRTAGQLLALGTEIEVLAPDELREELRRTALAVAKRYGK